MKRLRLLSNFIEAWPLCTFLIYINLHPPVLGYEWFAPYLLGSILAVPVTALVIYQGLPINRIFMGIHLYFISGSLGLLLGWEWLNRFYGELDAAGMLLCIIILGLASLMSRGGFVGAQQAPRVQVLRASLVLVFGAIGAFMLSYYTQGNKLWAEFVPFIALFILQRALQARLQ